MNNNFALVEGKIVGDVRENAVGTTRKVYHFTVGNNRYWTDSKNERQVETSYIDCDFFVSNKFNASFITKGAFVSVKGRIKQDRWTDKENNKRSKTLIAADSVNEIKVQNLDSAKQTDETRKQEDCPI